MGSPYGTAERAKKFLNYTTCAKSGNGGGFLPVPTLPVILPFMPVQLKQLVRAILEEYALPQQGVHGVSHWARVLENGIRLAKVTNANIEVVQLFAVLHDAKRENEAVDDDHGRRGAEYAARLRGDLFDLPDHDFNLLYTACAQHTDGLVEADITIQTCWDADRLDLGRVEIEPEPQKLCTDAAKKPAMLKWADRRACFQIVPEIISRDWGIDTFGWGEM